jgi:hypothetical protein
MSSLSRKYNYTKTCLLIIIVFISNVLSDDLYSFELTNLNNDCHQMKYVLLNENNSEFYIEINAMKRIDSEYGSHCNSPVMYVKTESSVIFQPKDFLELYKFLTIETNRVKLELYRHTDHYIITKHFNPFHISIVQKTNSDMYRGITLDFREYSILLNKASQLLYDSGL